MYLKQVTGDRLSMFYITITTQPPFYGHYTGQSVIASTSSYELEDFVAAKFYYLHALADAGVLLNGVIYSVSIPYYVFLLMMSKSDI